MKMRVSRRSIEIIPEGPTDEAYVEEVLGLRKAGDAVFLVRRNAAGLNCIAYLETERPEIPTEVVS